MHQRDDLVEQAKRKALQCPFCAETELLYPSRRRLYDFPLLIVGRFYRCMSCYRRFFLIHRFLGSSAGSQ